MDFLFLANKKALNDFLVQHQVELLAKYSFFVQIGSRSENICHCVKALCIVPVILCVFHVKQLVHTLFDALYLNCNFQLLSHFKFYFLSLNMIMLLLSQG